ncbi:IS110 family transposase [Pirellulimonas nuda]|uniref:IS110 family transposase n=1 Tax=Pirellulimonas nuda TaxID=2528009 RepID=UPI0011AA7C19|nr:transposase [Pirellulimonas nuda]
MGFEPEEVVAERPGSSVTLDEGIAMKRFIGLDVHKAVVEVCVIDEKGERVFRRRIDCTREALLRFAEELTGEDSVALEVTTNAWAVADLAPAVCRSGCCQQPDEDQGDRRGEGQDR